MKDEVILKLLQKQAIENFAYKLCEGRIPNDPVVLAVKTELELMKEEEESEL